MKTSHIFIFSVVTLLLISCSNTNDNTTEEPKISVNDNDISLTKAQFKAGNFKIEKSIYTEKLL